MKKQIVNSIKKQLVFKPMFSIKYLNTFETKLTISKFEPRVVSNFSKFNSSKSIYFTNSMNFSNYPPHTKLTLPNLSPSMEAVSLYNY